MKLMMSEADKAHLRQIAEEALKRGQKGPLKFEREGRSLWLLISTFGKHEVLDPETWESLPLYDNEPKPIDPLHRLWNKTSMFE